MNINSKTTLKSIKAAFKSDFNLVIDDQIAKEVKTAKAAGCVVWAHGIYRSTRVGDTIQRADATGVKTLMSAYTTREWNSR